MCPFPCFRIAIIVAALCGLATPAFAQQDTGAPSQSPLRSLVPDDVDLPPHLLDTLDHFTQQMGDALRERDTRVVWLLDCSPSLQGHRETIARIIPLAVLTAERSETNDLETFVVVYGAASAELLHLEETGSDAALQRLANAFRRIPAEPSGKENVFGALIHAADRYAGEQGNPEGKRVLFLVLTDEPGDDSERVVDAIDRLKAGGVRCSIAGHVTPFLSERHLINWTYDDGFTEEIAIDAGIETATPQRVFDLPLSPVDVRRIPSGFGPWPLARLCDATGGEYLTDWSEYEVRFDAATLEKYAPDTSRPLAEIQAEIASHPALRALKEAGKAESDLGRWQEMPREFSPGEDRPLSELLTSAQKPAALVEFQLMQLYARLEPFDQKRGVFKRPRDRADYDLSIARVRAARVRLTTYNLMLARMKSAPLPLDADHDTWQLAPAEAVGPSLQNAIRQAESDLHRVIDDHPGTPWAAVAEQELAVPWGWEWGQQTGD